MSVELGATGGRVGLLLARLSGLTCAPGVLAMRGPVVVSSAAMSPVVAQPDSTAKTPVSASVEELARSPRKLTKEPFAKRQKKDKVQREVSVMKKSFPEPLSGSLRYREARPLRGLAEFAGVTKISS